MKSAFDDNCHLSLKCGNCGELFDCILSADSPAICPFCGHVYDGRTEELPKPADPIFDPASPVGYFTFFPPEDDGLI